MIFLNLDVIVIKEMMFYLEEIIDIIDFWYIGMVMICLIDNY